MRCCFSVGSAASVRMLWSRSASLMTTTRISSAIARNILRMFSACLLLMRQGAELAELGDTAHELAHIVTATAPRRR